jgi:hypothetical protein
LTTATLSSPQNDLQTQLKLSLVQIEERELIYFTENSYNIGTQAALLSGFAFAALMQAATVVADPNNDKFDAGSVHGNLIQASWAGVTVLAMLFEIMALVKATQLAITGPGLALRGPEGSMTRAISVMRIEYRAIGQLFYIGLFFTLISSAIFAFIIFGLPAAVTVFVLIAISMVWLGRSLSHMSKAMQYESVTGEMVNTGFFSGLMAVKNPGAVFSVTEGRQKSPVSAVGAPAAAPPRRRSAAAAAATLGGGRLGFSRLGVRLDKLRHREAASVRAGDGLNALTAAVRRSAARTATYH